MYIDNPNFSIVVPGGCNCHCDFCFYKDSPQKKVPPNYIQKLVETLINLPPRFKQISLTGGEPTISPMFLDILNVVRTFKYKFPKVVLTTNGTNLSSSDLNKSIFDTISHLNISRHAAEDCDNNYIFKSNGDIPSTNGLHWIINEAGKNLVDTTFNCILHRNDGCRDDALNFIKFAKQLGAKVCFRIPNGTLDPHCLETFFKKEFKPVESSCPACRRVNFIIEGCPVTFAYGLNEPSSEYKDIIYELIFQEDGITTLDWAGNIKYSDYVLRSLVVDKDQVMSNPHIVIGGTIPFMPANLSFSCNHNSSSKNINSNSGCGNYRGGC